MLIFSRTLHFKTCLYGIIIGVFSIANVEKCVASRGYREQRQRRQRQQKQKKEPPVSFVQNVVDIIRQYIDIIGLGIACLGFGFWFFFWDRGSPSPPARSGQHASQEHLPFLFGKKSSAKLAGGPNPRRDKDDNPVYEFDIKNPETIKYEISEEELQKLIDKSWNGTQYDGENKDPTFWGYEKMTEKLIQTLENFKKWEKEGKWYRFFADDDKAHFDWWIFANPRSSRGYGKKCAVYKEDVAYLHTYKYQDQGKKYPKYRGAHYIDLQKTAAEYVLASMGFWDLDQKQITGQCTRVHTAVRRGKMLHGTLLFNPEVYKIINAFTLCLRNVKEKNGKEKHPLESWGKNYMTENVT